MDKETRLKLRCPRCGSADVRTNKDGTTWCRHCGHGGKGAAFEEKSEVKSAE